VSDDFDAWMRQVDAYLFDELGLTSADLPDMLWADWHEEGLTPRQAARRALRAVEGWEL
jgi:hypothetical protein